MKKFNEAQIEVVKLNVADIITTSQTQKPDDPDAGEIL